MDMWPFKSKYQKLTREEVVDAICQLDKQSQELEDGLLEKQNKVNELMEKGRKETDKAIKLLYAKKINVLKKEREQDVQRILYLLYNSQLLNRLKNAIDDNQFFKNNTKMPLNKLLSDQKGLAKFLNQALNIRIAAEDILTDSDELFNAIEESYEKNETIYGMNEQDNALLAMLEQEDQVASEQELYEVNEKQKNVETKKE